MKSKVTSRGLIWILSISLVLILGFCSTSNGQTLSQSDKEIIVQQSFKEQACFLMGLKPDMLIYWDDTKAQWYIYTDSTSSIRTYMPSGANDWLDNEVNYIGESDGNTFGVFQWEYWKYACATTSLIQKRSDGSQWIRKVVPLDIQREVNAGNRITIPTLQNGYWSQYKYVKFDSGNRGPRPRTTAEKMNNPLFLIWHGGCKNKGLKNLFGLLK